MDGAPEDFELIIEVRVDIPSPLFLILLLW
jgi:hypothetical protein